jgi:hypothetical protein
MTDSARSYPQGTVNSSSAVSSTGINEGPGGCIGYGEATANVGPTGTTTNAQVVNAVPVNAGRLIKITVDGVLRASAATALQVDIIEDSTTILRRAFYIGGSGRDAAFHAVALSHSPSAGNHNYTLAIGVGGSGPTTSLDASSGPPATTAYVIVEDVGPDF